MRRQSDISVCGNNGDVFMTGDDPFSELVSSVTNVVSC